jgi:RNA polymerase sigma-70 factor (ECF subfamily)
MPSPVSSSTAPATSEPSGPSDAASDADAETPDRLSDAELEALRNRNPEAVRRHIYGNKDYLRSVLRRYTETDETARDLLQETFFQALRSLPNFRGESKLTTWLYSIAKNVALARYRKDKRRSPLEEETLTHVAAHHTERSTDPSGESPTWDPSAEAVRSEETALVQDALEELSENYREVIELRDLKELSTEETAERLGLTRVNVRVRLHRARTKLKGLLDDRLDADYHVAA